MLAASLGRNAGDRSFDQLEQRLLHALAGDIARDGRIFRFAADLVDFVDIHDAPLGALDIVIGALEELQNDVLHVLAHITGFGKRGGIGDRERHIEDPGQRLGQKGLADAGRADQQDIALLELDLVADLLLDADPLVMIVHRDGQDLLGPFLADDVFVQGPLDLRGLRQPRGLGFLGLFPFLGDDLIAEVHALVADENRRAGDQLLYLFLALAAERALERGGMFFFLFVGHTLTSPLLHREALFS